MHLIGKPPALEGDARGGAEGKIIPTKSIRGKNMSGGVVEHALLQVFKEMAFLTCLLAPVPETKALGIFQFFLK